MKIFASSLMLALMAAEALTAAAIRPSVHGLEFQSPQNQASVELFFQLPHPATPPQYTWPDKSSPADVAWWRSVTEKPRNRVRWPLLIASVGCGALAMITMVASLSIWCCRGKTEPVSPSALDTEKRTRVDACVESKSDC